VSGRREAEGKAIDVKLVASVLKPLSCWRRHEDDVRIDCLTGTPDKKAAFYASVPLKRGGKPEEIADAIVFLASDKANLRHRANLQDQRRQNRELIAVAEEPSVWSTVMSVLFPPSTCVA
jgi:NAD(P)-dependent dehydrogenase (short-subunit alcohol dehydrogenase family)